MASRLFFAALALGLVSPAFAQEAPPPDRDDLAALEQFSSCVVDRDRRDAERLLQGDFREERYNAEMAELAREHRRCLGVFGGRLRMSGLLFAGAVAESLLHKNTTAATLASSLRPPEPAIEARSASEYTALCMALSHPADTSALLFSDALQAEGDALLVAYAEKLPPCVPAGQDTMRINKPGLRAIVALAAWRLAQVNRPSGES